MKGFVISYALEHRRPLRVNPLIGFKAIITLAPLAIGLVCGCRTCSEHENSAKVRFAPDDPDRHLSAEELFLIESEKIPIVRRGHLPYSVRSPADAYDGFMLWEMSNLTLPLSRVPAAVTASFYHFVFAPEGKPGPWSGVAIHRQTGRWMIWSYNVP